MSTYRTMHTNSPKPDRIAFASTTATAIATPPMPHRQCFHLQSRPKSPQHGGVTRCIVCVSHAHAGNFTLGHSPIRMQIYLNGSALKTDILKFRQLSSLQILIKWGIAKHYFLNLSETRTCRLFKSSEPFKPHGQETDVRHKEYINSWLRWQVSLWFANRKCTTTKIQWNLVANWILLHLERFWFKFVAYADDEAIAIKGAFPIVLRDLMLI